MRIMYNLGGRHRNSLRFRRGLIAFFLCVFFLSLQLPFTSTPTRFSCFSVPVLPSILLDPSKTPVVSLLLLCHFSDALRPAPAVATLLNTSDSEDSYRYTVKQSDEGSVVTSPNTTSPENEVNSSDHTHRKSKCLKEMSGTKQVGGKGRPRKVNSLLRRKRGRSPPDKLHRHNQCSSPLTAFLQLWKPSLPTTGAGLGWDDSHNVTEKAKDQYVLSQIAVLTDRCHIITLELSHCGME